MQVAVAILGFSDFERDALSFCIRNAHGSPAQYVLVEPLSDAELIVADADVPGVVERIVMDARTPHVVFVGKTVVPGASGVLPRPIDPSRVLRQLDEFGAEVLRARIVAWAEPAPGFAPSAASVVEPALGPFVGRFEEPVPEPIVEPIVEPAHEPTAPAPAPAPRPPGSDARMAARAKTRAAVRQARLAGDDAAPAPADVLLVDAEPEQRDALCALLGLFGFVVHAADSVDDALRRLAEKRPFVAVFADVPLDGSDGDEGIGLCRRVKSRPDAPVLLLVTRPAGAADQVRAMLAGVDAQIDKPVTRGAVARALEERGVRLPADARRA